MNAPKANKALLSLFLAATLATCCGMALAQGDAGSGAEDSAPAAAAQATLAATGTATVRLTPDISVLTFTVEATDRSVSTAQTQADDKLNAMVKAFGQLGVAKEDISAASYTVQTVYDFQYSKLANQEQESGYTITANLAVRLRDRKRASEVVDTAIMSGANSGYAITFESSKTSQAYDEALIAATADALRKAELLAKAAGRELDELRTVVEKTDGVATTMQVTQEGNTDTALHDTLSVTAKVEVQFTLR
ncbi:MAG: SIMPL domain-containing protein [Clostridia bacterium]